MSRSLYLAGGLAAIFLIVLAQRVTVVPTASVGHAAATSAARKAPDDATATPDDPAATAIDDLAAWPGVTRR